MAPNAVNKIRTSPEDAPKSFPWMPETVKEIDEDPEGIDEIPSFVVLQEKLKEEDKE